MPNDISVSELPEANWPLVIGIGILAAVVFYALYIVNNAATTVETPLGQILAAIAAPFQAITNLFTGNNNNDQ